MDGKLIRQVALYIIDNHTIEEACNEFNLSRNTIIKYCNLVRTKGVYFNPEIAEKLNSSMAKNRRQGKIAGGQNGHIEHIFSEEQVKVFVLEIIEENKTLREIATKHNSNPGTIYNSIRRLNDKELLKRLKEHYEKRGITWGR